MGTKSFIKKKWEEHTSKLKPNVTLPFSSSKKYPLTTEQKKHNKALASFRVKVANLLVN